MTRSLLRLIIVTLTAWTLPLQVLAQESAQPKILTNQHYLESVNKQQRLNLHSIPQVFNHVFSNLPNEVTVYPTENYYYFSFYHNGVQLSGNIRLDALDRDKGIAHFAYFTTFNRWNEELLNHYQKMTAKEGLAIEKLKDLQYRLTYNDKSVIFNLNDLSHVSPPLSKIRQDEEFIGPVYDESGIQFYLVYDDKINRFFYILNESEAIPDTLTPSRTSPDILIGTRTGFSFYRDAFKNRLILIGVYSGNSMVNNYFDGPFDQLPDNFIKGDNLKNAFIDQRPELKDKIDRFGNTDNGSSRVLITPYIHYSHESQLNVFKECTNEAGFDKKAYYTCFKQQEPDRME